MQNYFAPIITSAPIIAVPHNHISAYTKYHWRRSIKKLFVKISQYSLEITCVEVS